MATQPLVGDPPEDQKWTFDDRFDPKDPWAQRAMLEICTKVPEELLVHKFPCWLVGFRKWLLDSGKQFPTLNFDEDLRQYLVISAAADFQVWMVDGKLKATFFNVIVRYPKEAPAEKHLVLMKRWDKYLKEMNWWSAATANGAWHTSRSWVLGEAETAIKSSTYGTIAVSVGAGFVGTTIFTQDPTLALYVVFWVISIISGLAFFMVVVMGWSIGPIEVISLVVFVGYSVTYSLHIAHRYAESHAEECPLMPTPPPSPAPSRQVSPSGLSVGSPKNKSEGDDDEKGNKKTPEASFSRKVMREARCLEAVELVGGAVLGSAITTLVSSFFLMFCVLRVFFKLGVVVFIVTFLSIFFALLVLPATLFSAGPTLPFGQRMMKHMNYLMAPFRGKSKKL